MSSESTDLASTAGSIFLGGLFNWGLYGVLAYQVFIYYAAFPRDGWSACGIVYGVFLLDTVQTVLVTIDLFNTFAKHYGDRALLDGAQFEWFAVPVLIACVVQLYYAHRVRVLSGSRRLPVPIVVLALVAAVAGIVSGARFEQVGRFSLLQAKDSIFTGIWLAGDALCDMIIAALMSYLLLRNDHTLALPYAAARRLVHLTIETGALTACAALADALLFFALPHSTYHACAAMALAKLYSNALLVVLNSRLRIAGGRGFSTPLPASDEEDGGGGGTRLETLVFARRTLGEGESGLVAARLSGGHEPSNSKKPPALPAGSGALS
ncbi:hypothetical protein PHLGIDRAFT_124344 [Phlebiopsis gigantea 11061_1 CR5-6]|uniref:DUF6534 domain-containing protein n=1 Tax=Phlebiopsis gigantea (strain 11061_1 CR5-6) TaxID=745531 RepID=A0A0C3SDV5_PHLG1|nr:hypothetical protein PHLGIDRAFT_124344 [Phlebiopsis gigantea 11061_1 CR5-6]